jgi:hypothetical protein
VNQSIWKYELRVVDHQTVQMPIGARILTVQVQRDALCLWAIVDQEAKRETRIFCIFGTGERFNRPDATYIGTVQDGDFVWHVFEA